MEVDKVHIPHCMLYEFQKKNATKATENICSVYGENVLNVRTCQFWFKRFREGKFDLSDNQRSGRSSTIDNDELVTLIESNVA
jgi:histone-lysine N-methyltransferase SETMAR